MAATEGLLALAKWGVAPEVALAAINQSSGRRFGIRPRVLRSVSMKPFGFCPQYGDRKATSRARAFGKIQPWICTGAHGKGFLAAEAKQELLTETWVKHRTATLVATFYNLVYQVRGYCAPDLLLSMLAWPPSGLLSTTLSLLKFVQLSPCEPKVNFWNSRDILLSGSRGGGKFTIAGTTQK